MSPRAQIVSAGTMPPRKTMVSVPSFSTSDQRGAVFPSRR
jgi:hypothetical protein